MNVQDVFNKVKQLVTDHPSNIYVRPEGDSSCQYSAGNCTEYGVGCLIGQAIKELDPEFDLAENEQTSARMIITEFVKSHDERMDVDFITVRFLTHVQNGQDKGLSWADAWNEAIKKVDRVYNDPNFIKHQI